MNISSVNSDLIRGNVTTIILGSLWTSDRYGYDILKEIETKSDGQYKIKQATLYNQLKKLEEQGLVSSYDGDPDDTGGGKRKYFSLTAEGRTFLKKEKTEYEYARTILDRLVSSQEFDFNAPLPFEASELRPYSKKNEEAKPKVVYKDKIVEKYLDRYGNEITKEEIEQILQKEAEEKEQQELLEKERQEKEDEIRQDNESKAQEISELKEKLAYQEDLNKKYQSDNEEISNKIKEIEQEKNQITENYDKQVELYNQTKEEKLEIQNKLNEIEYKQEQERLKVEEEERILREKQKQPSLSVEEMFNKLDSESEYSKTVDYKTLPEERYYFNGFSGEVEKVSYGQTSLHDALKQLEEEENQIDSKSYAQSTPLKAKEDKFVTSAVISRPDTQFEYEDQDVNYREFFFGISNNDEKNIEPQDKVDTSIDIKTRLYSKGFKIRPYDRGNTSEYYTFNFIHSNRLLKDSFLIVLAVFLLEIGVMWASLATKVTYVYFLPFTLIGSALLLIPLFIYLKNPAKRSRAQFNFKFSILNTTMFWIELSVVAILIGFLGVGASIDDTLSVICTIVLPMILLTNIPLSTVVYWLLYKTRRYHTA